jgi:hypothetical protein
MDRGCTQVRNAMEFPIAYPRGSDERGSPDSLLHPVREHLASRPKLSAAAGHARPMTSPYESAADWNRQNPPGTLVRVALRDGRSLSPEHAPTPSSGAPSRWSRWRDNPASSRRPRCSRCARLSYRLNAWP